MTGYRPIKISSPNVIDFDAVAERLHRYKSLSLKHDLYLLISSILKEDGIFYNGLNINVKFAVLKSCASKPAPALCLAAAKN